MESLTPRFQRWVEECNEGAALLRELVPLVVDGAAVGYVSLRFAQELARFVGVFTLQEAGAASPPYSPLPSSDEASSQQQEGGPDSSQQQEGGSMEVEGQPEHKRSRGEWGAQPAAAGSGPGGGRQVVVINPGLATPQQRTAAIEEVLESLRVEGKMGDWVGELYPVVRAFDAEPVFLVERAAATLLGIKAYGVHINGYVTLPDGSQEMWLARRSRSRPTWPGKLDQIVAGGQPHGISCIDNVVKECEEEASIPQELARRARAVGAVSYTSFKLGGLGRDVMLCYDLELPLDFVPRPQDGEVEEFVRLPVRRVADIVAHPTPEAELKTNCNLVVIDFLFRHGYLTPDLPGYLPLLAGLRSGDCS